MEEWCHISTRVVPYILPLLGPGEPCLSGDLAVTKADQAAERVGVSSISEWRHDFRPSYLELGAVRARLTCPLLALTLSHVTVNTHVDRHLRRHYIY